MSRRRKAAAGAGVVVIATAITAFPSTGQEVIDLPVGHSPQHP